MKNFLIFIYVVASVILVYLFTLLFNATFSEKKVLFYTIDSNSEGLGGRVMRYRIVEVREYGSNNYITLNDTCDVYDAIKVQRELNSNIKK